MDMPTPLAGITASLPIKEVILLPIHVQVNPSVTETSTCNTIEANQADDQEWTEDIISYLRTSTLPEEPKQAHKIRVQAARFTLIEGHLYKQSFTGPYLRCLNHSKALYVLAELHEGVCGNHSGGRSLAHKAHSQGYYWPTMKKDAAAYVRKCDKCQRHAPIPHVPSETLKPISGPWPFAQWGMDIVGPYQPQLRRKNSCSSPRITSVNGWKLKHTLASKTNMSPKFLFGTKHPEFILHTALSSKQWTSRGHKQDPNNCLKKEARASQKEVGRGATQCPVGLSNHTRIVDRKHSLRPRIRNLNWADKVRETASIRMADYQQRAAAHYNRKFQANWEGPYIVSKTSESGAYHLQKLDGTPLLRPWNVLWTTDTERNNSKSYKKKSSLGRLAAQLFLLTQGNRRDVLFDTMLLHAATDLFKASTLSSEALRAADKLASACSNLEHNSSSPLTRWETKAFM
ncbi:hypothetical protein CK203_058942 [Vitis vinifera]|uniref:Integrase zinc-binding domain-containing protein n=1 Tax=Vitis vinifera TaxID=29760 RepID=A0A438FQ44_VITVI|nr:hypothetical protein CK203_058942 [Vitis vinifera]